MDDLKIWGPPGTGKTHTAREWMLNRITKNGCDPTRVAFVSYTNAAVDVAIERVGGACNLGPADLPYCATLHALCKRVLGVQGDWLADDHLTDFAESYGWELKARRGVVNDDGDLEEIAEKRGRDAICLQIWDFARQRLIDDPNEAYLEFLRYDLESGRRVGRAHFAQFVADYERWKTVNILRDYTDLLTEFTQHPRALPISVAVLDEAQDCSPLLWRVWDQITAKAEYRAVAADDDQAIYGYSGAKPELFNRRPARHRMKLSQSHRLSRAVAGVALGVISQNQNREPKIVRPKDVEGYVGRVALLEDALSHDPGSFYVLIRNWRLLKQITDDLEFQGIPYRMGGGRYCPWSDRGPLHAAHALAKLAAGEKVSREELRQLAKRLRADRKEGAPLHFGSKTKLEAWAKADPGDTLNLPELWETGWVTEDGAHRMVRKDWTLLELETTDRDRNAYAQADERGKLRERPRVQVGSIHGHKGAEADNVVVLAGCTGATERAVLDNNRREEEVRVAYVGVTRARRNCYILRPRMEPGIREGNLIDA
jgi:superfamily I DNA/RNA helicase